MFRCENEYCGLIVQARQPVNRIVAERRERTYEIVNKRGKNKGKTEIVRGWEIVKELKVCPRCYRTLTGKSPKVVEEEKQQVEFKNAPHKTKKWKDIKKEPKKKHTSQKKPIVEVINPIKVIKE